MILNMGPSALKPDIINQAYAYCEDKGGTIPASQNIENLPSCINSIPNVTNFSASFMDLGVSNVDQKKIQFTVPGEVNSLIMIFVGYMGSMEYAVRRVIKLIHSDYLYNTAASLGGAAGNASRYKFLLTPGIEIPTSGRTQSQYYVANFDNVTYAYDNNNDNTTITIDISNAQLSFGDSTNQSANVQTTPDSAITLGPRFNGPYHVFAFKADSTNTTMGQTSATVLRSLTLVPDDNNGEPLITNDNEDLEGY